MDALSRQVTQRTIDHPLSFEPRHAGKRCALDLDRKVALTGTVIAHMAAMFRAVVAHCEAGRGERRAEERFDFALNCAHQSFFAFRETPYRAAMRITITKEANGDRLDIVRADGSHAVTHFPRKGPTPHDAVHYFVERDGGLNRAFWGLVAGGMAPEGIQDMAKAGGHASAKRADVPHGSLIELLQAERLVECFEATLWGGQLDLLSFRSVAATACESSHVPMPDLSDKTIAGIHAEVVALATRWGAAPAGETVILDWAE